MHKNELASNKTSIKVKLHSKIRMRNKEFNLISLKIISFKINVTEFAKTDLMGTNTEIHFLPVDESHTHALSRDTKRLRLDGQVCFFRRLFPTL